MNWDITDANILGTAGAPHDCWNGLPTQKKGGTLEWVLAGIDVRVDPIDLTDMKDVYDMTGPDHRPILFDLTTS